MLNKENESSSGLIASGIKQLTSSLSGAHMLLGCEMEAILQSTLESMIPE